jgi:periplasmic protein TonB
MGLTVEPLPFTTLAPPKRLFGFLVGSLSLHAILLSPWRAVTPTLVGSPETVLSISFSELREPPAVSVCGGAVRTGNVERPAPPRKQAPPTDAGPVTAAAATPALLEHPPDIDRHEREPDPSGEAVRARVHAQFHAGLDRYFTYPRLAAQRGWQGTVWLAFRVEPDGALGRIQVAASSGYAVLDRSAVEAADKIGYLTDADRWLNGRALEMRVPVVYRLIDR